MVAIDMFGADTSTWRVADIPPGMETALYEIGSPAPVKEEDAPAALDEIERILRGD